MFHEQNLIIFQIAFSSQKANISSKKQYIHQEVSHIEILIRNFVKI